MTTKTYCIALLMIACNGPEPKGDLKALQGMWECTSFQREGTLDEDMIGARLKIVNDRVQFLFDRGTKSCRIELLEDKRDPKKLVWRQIWIKGLELEIEFQGIYVLDGDTMMICLPVNSSGPRPKQFSSSKEGRQALIVLKRLKE